MYLKTNVIHWLSSELYIALHGWLICTVYSYHKINVLTQKRLRHDVVMIS